jgi:RNA polymerase sigma-70 factor (ECF subfamily)
MHDERHIIERVLAGDAGAFRMFVESHHHLVFQFVRNMLRSIPDAEDLTQDVFVTAFLKLSTFDSRQAKVSTWLLTIARNRCCNHLKRRQSETPGDVDSHDRGPLPEEAASQQEVWQQLSMALDSLPLDQRTAFVLAEIQELPYTEIALIEEIEVGTVKSRVSRARERLRQAMKAWKPEDRPDLQTRPAKKVCNSGETHEPG